VAVSGAVDAVDVVLDQVAAVTDSAEEAVDEVLPHAEATLAPATEAAEATQAVLPAQIVAVATHAPEAAAPQDKDAPVSPAMVPVEAALTVPAPPIHDVWALERRADDDHAVALSNATPAVTIEPIAIEDLTMVEPSATEPLVAAKVLGAEAIGENSVVGASHSTWSGIPHSAAAFEAQTLFEPAANGSASTDPVLPEPTAPFSALPASIGLSTTAAAGWLPSFAQLTVLDHWRPWSHTAPRGRSVIVLPNLAPPG
jgi:hypothetical protein